MKVLVTGAAGFIGSAIACRLVREGLEVLGLDDLSSGRREAVPGGIRLVVAGVETSQAADLIRTERPEIIVHQAAQVDLRRSVADPLSDARSNVLGTLNLADAAVRSGVRRFLFASTGGAIYGDQERHPADETHPTRPVSPYGCAKLASEVYLGSFAHNYGLEVLNLRYANVYGPGQNPHSEAGVVAIFTAKLLAGEAVIIHGDGEQTRDYVFVEDVVEANWKALNHPGSGTFNVGTGVETTVNDLAALLVRLAGRGDGPHRHGPAKVGEQRRSSLDASRARRELGWAPSVDLAGGLARTVEAFRAGPRGERRHS